MNCKTCEHWKGLNVKFKFEQITTGKKEAGICKLIYRKVADVEADEIVKVHYLTFENYGCKSYLTIET
jgi:hypothetical protein